MQSITTKGKSALIEHEENQNLLLLGLSCFVLCMGIYSGPWLEDDTALFYMRACPWLVCVLFSSAIVATN